MISQKNSRDSIQAFDNWGALSLSIPGIRANSMNEVRVFDACAVGGFCVFISNEKTTSGICVLISNEKTTSGIYDRVGTKKGTLRRTKLHRKFHRAGLSFEIDGVEVNFTPTALRRCTVSYLYFFLGPEKEKVMIGHSPSETAKKF